MRQVIPFSKNIEFNTMISEITNISLEHTLKLQDEYNVCGDFIVSGKYKMNATSPQEEDFSYKIPIDITIDQKYKTDEIELEIDDFRYERVDSNKLKVDIDLSIDNLEKREDDSLEEQEVVVDELEESDDDRLILTDEEKQEIDALIKKDDTSDLFKENSLPEEVEISKSEETVAKMPVGSLFTAFKDTEETFTTYSVYIVREGDNVEDIINNYKTTREVLEEYNDMSNIKIGTKLIIPKTKDENNK